MSEGHVKRALLCLHGQLIIHTLRVLILESLHLFDILMFWNTVIKGPWFLVSMDLLLIYLQPYL